MTEPRFAARPADDPQDDAPPRTGRGGPFRAG